MTHKTRGLWRAAALAALALVGLAGWSLGTRPGPHGPSPARGATRPGRPAPGDLPTAAVADRDAYDPGQAGRTVAFWKAQAARDPQGGLERRQLAAALLALHRERGDIDDAVRAEAAARDSLKILPRGNAAALGSLARSLLAQHRFPEALAEARRAAALDPDLNRLVADVQIETGDLDDAARALAAAPPEADDPNYEALHARLEKARGRPALALKILEQARNFADSRPDLPAETVAWYRMMVGHSQTEAGRLDDAAKSCRSALEVFPDDYRAMTGLAEVASWRGDWAGAVAWSDKALAVCPQNPEALKILGDAHEAQGRPDEAARAFDRLKALAHSFPRIYDRHWALFCADKGRDLDEALALARADLEIRHDALSYGALAWVCFQKGMQAEAASSMRTALAAGPEDARLLFKAGLIARAGGDAGAARDCFRRARAANPRAVPRRWVRWLESPDDAPVP